jgi:type VI secretion system secreted protein Hcp
MEPTIKPAASRRTWVRRALACGAALTLAGTVAVTVSASASSVKPHNLGAGADIYMTFPTVKGEGSSAGGPGTIEISSFSWGATNTSSSGSGGGGGSGKVKFSTVTVTKVLDSTSPVFFAATTAGRHFTTVTLSIRRFVPSGEAPTSDALDIQLNNAWVTSYSMSSGGAGSNQAPTETITIAYAAIQMLYTPAIPSNPGQPGGPVGAGWNLTTHRAF